MTITITAIIAMAMAPEIRPSRTVTEPRTKTKAPTRLISSQIPTGFDIDVDNHVMNEENHDEHCEREHETD
jgi:hypothetical protein